MIKSDGNGGFNIKMITLIIGFAAPIITMVGGYFAGHSALAISIEEMRGVNNLQDARDIRLQEEVDTIACRMVSIMEIPRKIDSLNWKIDGLIKMRDGD